MTESENNSRLIISNQEGLHPDLEKIVRKHAQTVFHHPIHSHAFEALELIKQKQAGRKLILDSGCGTGMSTLFLAERFPDHFVIGVDQSIHRLQKHQASETNNLLLIRANLIDLWCAMEKYQWHVDQHYLFYPNPWPKKKHLQRRWHGSPVFPALLRLGGVLELRSNWKIYVEEFAEALRIVKGISINVEHFTPDHSISLFEQKYQASGHSLYRLHVQL